MKRDVAQNGGIPFILSEICVAYEESPLRNSILMFDDHLC